jgi:hypothetical protein
MGDKDVVMILPKGSPLIKEYTDLAEQWKKTQEVQGCKFEIKYDADLQELPDKASWIVGFDNKFASEPFMCSMTMQDIYRKKPLPRLTR